MDWVRLQVKELRGPSWAGIADAVRGNWVTLLALCAWEENGGRIDGARSWTPQQWAAASVTRRKAEAVVAAGLAQWDGEDLMVSRYPKADEDQCRQNRENGKLRAESLRKQKAGAQAPAIPCAPTELEEEKRGRSPEFSAKAEGTEEQQGGKGKKPRTKKPAVAPIPFTIQQLFEALVTGSKGRFLAEGFDPRLAAPITAVIRLAAAEGYALADAQIAGEFIASRWRPGIDVGPSWVAKTGNLLDCMAKARRWAAEGRRPFANGTHPGNNRVATAVDQGWRHKVNLEGVELEYLRRNITPEWWADPARALMTDDADGRPLRSPAQLQEIVAKERARA